MVVEQEDQLVVLLLLARELDAVIAPRQKRLVDQPVLSVVPLRTPAVVFRPVAHLLARLGGLLLRFVTTVCRAGRRDATRVGSRRAFTRALACKWGKRGRPRKGDHASDGPVFLRRPTAHPPRQRTTPAVIPRWRPLTAHLPRKLAILPRLSRRRAAAAAVLLGVYGGAEDRHELAVLVFESGGELKLLGGAHVGILGVGLELALTIALLVQLGEHAAQRRRPLAPPAPRPCRRRRVRSLAKGQRLAILRRLECVAVGAVVPHGGRFAWS